MSKISSASRIISKTMKNCRKKIHKKRHDWEWERHRERPVWINHLSFLHSLSPSHSISLLQLNIYTAFHTACACQPVNIISLSAQYIFQSSPDDRFCQSPSETQIRAIWKPLRHLFVEPRHWQFHKISSLPPLEEGESDCVDYVRGLANRWMTICVHVWSALILLAGLDHMGYVNRAKLKEWMWRLQKLWRFFLPRPLGKRALHHIQKHRTGCLDLKPSDVKTLLWCLTLPQSHGHGVYTEQIAKSKGQAIRIYTAPI